MPNPKFDGLKNPTPLDTEPTQYRQTGVAHAAKSQHYRIDVKGTKFSKDSDLLAFQKDVMDHLTNYGLDTITYLADPQDKESMVSIVTDHAKYNPREVNALEASQKELYDKYDNANIRDARKYLMNSLSPDLKKQMNETCQPDDTFIAYWMNLMILVRPVSIRQFEKIKNRLKGRKIKNYPGENVETISSDFLSDYKELEGAGMYDHNLTYSMLNILMEGGGSNNEDFRSPLRTLKEKLNTTLLKIRHKSYGEQNKEMTMDRLDVQSILNQVKERYRDVKEEGK